MKKAPFLFVLTLSPAFIFAQSIDRQVIGAAGLVGNAANVEMIATVGETATATFSAGSFEITQGFEQPDGQIIATNTPTIRVDFSVFPNPTSDELHVNFWPAESIELGLQLISNDGKLVRELQKTTKFAAGENNNLFKMNDLAAGNYFLVALDRSGKVVKTLAVVKI
jgi:hypothetical protein